jgi:hypothetical protein
MSCRLWLIPYDILGPIARVGPNHLVTSDHRVLLHITNPRSGWKRSEWYRAFSFDPTGDSVLSETNDKKHGYLRARMATGYAGKENPDIENRIDARVADTIDLIQRKYLSTPGNIRVMDFCSLSAYFTQDVISDIAFGEPFGCMVQDADVYGFMRTFEDSGRFLQVSALFPSLMRVLEKDWVRRLFRAPRPTDKTGLGRVMRLGEEIVSKRFQSEKPDQMDMLGAPII